MLEIHLHPVLSSVPFALLSVALVAESVRLFNKQVAEEMIAWNVYAASFFIAAAFLTGYVAAGHAHLVLGIEETKIGSHHLLGKGLLFASIVMVIAYFVSRRAQFNRRFFHLLFRLLLVFSWGLSMITGFRGGEMLLEPRPSATGVPHE